VKTILPTLIAAVFAFSAAWLYACQVPVFRYAFERWEPDKYEALILHDGPLAADDRQRLKELQEAIPPMANVAIRPIDTRHLDDQEIKERLQPFRFTGTTTLALLYPRSAQEVPQRLVHTVPLASESLRHLFDSPVRRELAARLEKGQSAVWIFVPSGKAVQDKEAWERLSQALARDRKELKLPPVEDLEAESPEVQAKVAELQLEFSALPLDTQDPSEAFLLQMLLASESDLATAGEPLAFPAFGRGRVLYALVGMGINSEMIRRANQFIVGPCSCQVKAQNPGFDLLTAADWEGLVGDLKISDPLPDANAAPVLLEIPRGRKKE
jgi:hypothetical protein